MLAMRGLGEVLRPVECSTGPGCVDLLGVALGRSAERGCVGDAVAVAVGGNGAGGLPLGVCAAGLLRRRPERRRPAPLLGERGVEESVGTRLDEFAPFRECRSQLGAHGAGGLSLGTLRARPDPAGLAAEWVTR
jgi:hypothetical protein